MTQAAYGNLPAGFTSVKPTSFVTSTGTTSKVVVDPADFPAALASSTLPPYYGGATLLDLTVVSSDSVARTLNFSQGHILTTQDATDTGAITLTAQNKLSRANGSWIADGWQVGDSVLPFAPRSLSQVAAGIDGIGGLVTAVTATDLTVSGTPWAAGTNVLVAGTRLVAGVQLFATSIPAFSGTVAGTPSVSLLANSNDGSIIRTERKLGTSTLLYASVSGVTASAQIALAPVLGRY